MDITQDALHGYCGSDDYWADLTAVSANPTPFIMKNGPSNGGVVDPLSSLTVQDFRRGVKRDKTHYEDLKDDKYFNSWNCGFVAYTHINQTHLVLDKSSVPKSDPTRRAELAKNFCLRLKAWALRLDSATLR